MMSVDLKHSRGKSKTRFILLWVAIHKGGTIIYNLQNYFNSNTSTLGRELFNSLSCISTLRSDVRTPSTHPHNETSRTEGPVGHPLQNSCAKGSNSTIHHYLQGTMRWFWYDLKNLPAETWDLIMKIKDTKDTEEHKTCYPIIRETYKCSGKKWVEWIIKFQI